MKTNQVHLQCPGCDHTFTSQLVVDFPLAGQDSDYCPQYSGPNPLPHMLHTCSECGFIGFQADFSSIDDQDALLRLRQAIRGFQNADGSVDVESLSGAERYRRAAVFALYMGRSNTEIAELYLQATWCARLDEEGEESQQRARRKAAEYFERALDSGELSETDQPAAHYLIGELRRRLGDEDAALAHFDAINAYQGVDPAIRELRDEQRASIRRSAVSDD